jgi:uncharacterized glyoxalase superfamily protein PhnB
MSNTIHEVFPYLRVRDANAAIEFYKKAFGAEEKFRLSEPSGRIGQRSPETCPRIRTPDPAENTVNHNSWSP